MDAQTQLKKIVRFVSTSAEELYERILQDGYISIRGDTPSVDRIAAKELEDYGFVYRKTTPTGYDLFPTPFEILITSLLYRLDWSYPPFADITTEDRDHFQNKLKNLLTKKDLPSFSPFPALGLTQTIEGAANIDAFVARVLYHTQDLCAISAAEWSANLPLLWTVLVQRIKEGMRYRRIVSPLGLAAFGWIINDRDISETGVNLRVTLAQTLSPFYLFTGDYLHSALVFVPTIGDNTQLRASYTTLMPLTGHLSQMFNELWQAATSARSVLDWLWSYRPTYVEQAYHSCGETGALVAEKLFDMGIFAKLSPNEVRVVHCLIDSGLVIETKYRIGLSHYAPNIIEQITHCVREGEVK